MGKPMAGSALANLYRAKCKLHARYDLGGRCQQHHHFLGQIGYGGAAPRVPGSLVLNMGKRLNKVLNIDEKAATCALLPRPSSLAAADSYPFYC